MPNAVPMSAMLSDEEVDELLTQVILDDELYRAASTVATVIDESLVSGPTQRAVWAARCALGDSFRPAHFSALRSATLKELEYSDTIILEDMFELVGKDLPKWAKKKFPDHELYDYDSGPCFFDRLRAALDEPLDTERGRALLERFIYERHCAEALREELSLPVLPTDPAELKSMIDSRFEMLNELRPVASQAFLDQWETHDRQLRRYRGRPFLGLRTGQPRLDANTSGLRDLMLLAALPGGGKTAYTLELALGVCRHHAENDAVVVFVSLEMDKATILNRLKCNLADMDFSTLMHGSPSVQHRNSRREDLPTDPTTVPEQEDRETWFDDDDRQKLCDAERRRDEYELGDRFILLDRSDLVPRNFANQVVRVVRQAKQAAGAARALVVVDYLQVIPVPPEIERQGDLAADRCRVAVLQELLAGIGDDALPDCVLAISEARKPNKATTGWASQLSELMGSARLGYAASAVLLYQPMAESDVQRYYGTLIPCGTVQRRLDEQHIAPVELKLVKGRDGMRRSAWGVEYRYHRNTFQEIDERCVVNETDIGEVCPPAANHTAEVSSPAPHRQEHGITPRLPRRKKVVGRNPKKVVRRKKKRTGR